MWMMINSTHEMVEICIIQDYRSVVVDYYNLCNILYLFSTYCQLY